MSMVMMYRVFDVCRRGGCHRSLAGWLLISREMRWIYPDSSQSDHHRDHRRPRLTGDPAPTRAAQREGRCITEARDDRKMAWDAKDARCQARSGRGRPGTTPANPEPERLLSPPQFVRLIPSAGHKRGGVMTRFHHARVAQGKPTNGIVVADNSINTRSQSTESQRSADQLMRRRSVSMHVAGGFHYRDDVSLENSDLEGNKSCRRRRVRRQAGRQAGRDGV